MVSASPSTKTKSRLFSVYLRTQEGFAECIANVHTCANAEAVASAFALLLELDDDDDDETARPA